MAKIYLAVNGDQVGGKISEAIQSNDPEQVRQMSASFNQAHAEIDQWVEKNGGRVISASGDEAIYELEESKMPEMERLMSNYESATGHTLTVGAGDDMLQAVKAMVYGKMHDAGQIIQYDEEVESAITPQQEQEAEEIADETGEEIEEGVDFEEGDEGQEDSQFADENGEEMEMGQEQPEMSEEDEELEDEELEDEEGQDTVEMPKDKFVEEHENLVDTLRSPEHEDDLEEADEQEQELDEYTDEDDQDLEQEGVEFNDSETPEEDQEIPEEEGFEEMSEEDDMGEQSPEMSEEDDMENEEESSPSPISDMVHANSEMDQEEPTQEGAQQGSSELKQRVMDTLMSFKANKEKIQVLQQADPEMYQNVIDMLNSMISMAKELQVSPEKEIAAQEGMDEIPDLEEQEIKKPMGRM